MSIVIKMILLALAAVFPKFKMGYGVFLIILMTFVSLFAFSAAYLDHSFGEPSWIVRNELGLQKSGVRFVAADNPDANELTVGILAIVAENEARAISQRTMAALDAAKARGQVLGAYS